MTKAPLFSCSSFATPQLARAALTTSIALRYARRHRLPSCETDSRKRITHWGRPARPVPDRLMIKLDRLLFLVGVGLLVIGVGISVVVIVVGTISFLLNLLG